MLPFQTLTALFEIATARWSPRPWANAAAPTPESLSRIRRELGVRVPDDFARLAAACPSYGSWFASIGDDFDNGLHIVRLNELFHDDRRLHDGAEGPALPPHLVLINHGHDGDCDCWDTTVVAPSGEHPIVYLSLGDPGAQPSGTPFQSFRAYAEHLALRQARSAADRRQRRRAQRLIADLVEDARDPPGPVGHPPGIQLRRAHPEDAEAIAQAHIDAIKAIGSAFYPLEVVEAWGAGITPGMYVEAMAGGEAFFIATGQIDGKAAVLGFATHRVDDEQDGASVYVRGRAARRGIGTALLRLAEAHAVAHGARSIQIQASLAGVEFYKVNGFEETGRGEARLTSGRSMPCVLMQKHLR